MTAFIVFCLAAWLGFVALKWIVKNAKLFFSVVAILVIGFVVFALYDGNYALIALALMAFTLRLEMKS